MSHEHKHHITSLPVLFGTFFALVGLTILTVFLATRGFDFGRFDVGVAMAIATVKALLVALIFMQLIHDKAFNGIIMISSLLFVGLFLGITMLDSRATQPDRDAFRLQEYTDSATP